MTILRTTASAAVLVARTAVLVARTVIGGLSAAGDQWAIGLGCDGCRR